MPFKLKLKKTRQYNVVSKSLFVISIELLDGVVVECTLGSDSTGQECLENVCQRLVINQSEFFGLRYTSRTQQPRWVDLERPLKRQLDKHASSHQLYLRVMYYVISGTGLITDEMTRYHYFLQLKNDLIEGRIVCDRQQAVLLASYSRQAEYGNHDTERHTVDYLKNSLSFPKQMIIDGGQIIDGNQLVESGQLEHLTAAVILHHQALQNLPQAQAEEGYISACQLLTGYGQETFNARDHTRQNNVQISILLTGIMVDIQNNEAPKFYRWTDITNVINHKRTFSVECQNPSDSATFVFGSSDDGKYVWRLCVLQHTFYMNHQQSAHIPNNNTSTPTNHQNQPQPKFQNDGLSDSRDDLDFIPLNKAISGSMPGLLESHDLKSLIHGGSQHGLQVEHSHPLTNAQRALSTSCLDLTNSNSHLQSQNDIDKLRALLPSYRAAPDYDTAIQQKHIQRLDPLHFQNHQPHGHTHPDPMNLTKPLIYGSQPEIHRPIHYPDVTRHTAAFNSPDIPYAVTPIRHDPHTAFSLESPALSAAHQQIQYLNVYKPPPPYPNNGLASNSTPDLAVASQSIGPIGHHIGYISPHVSGSSPDLVSSRTFLTRQYMSHIHAGNAHNLLGYAGVQNMLPPAHGTYENLADIPNRHIIIEAPHHLADHIQKLHDDRGNIIYCMPAARVPYRNHMVMQQPPAMNVVSDSQEPIYENVPLPWQTEPMPSSIRHRAQSLTSPPEVTPITQRKSSQPVSIVLNNEQMCSVMPPPAAFNPNVLINSVHYSPDNPYRNLQILKTDKNTNIISNDTKVILNNNMVSSSNNLQDVTNSLMSTSISKDSAPSNAGNTTSLRGSAASLSASLKSTRIQQSDSNNITTITINSNADEKQAIGMGKNFVNFPKSVSLSDSFHNNSQISVASTLHSGLDITALTSSFFDSTQQSSAYELDISGISSATGSSVQIKEKKRRRWGMFGGKNSKTAVKSATLGRDRVKKAPTVSESNEKYRWSTASPKLQPLPSTISKETMCQLLERKMSDAQLSYAFERIPKGRDLNTGVTVALNPENSHLNAGNTEYLPYDDNRVRLTPSKVNKHGYINASHITASVGNSQRFYIACSVGPGSGSIAGATSFWQAVWEAGARLITFISASTSPFHLPDTLPGRLKEFGQFQVFVESSQSSGYVITSRLRVSNSKQGGAGSGTSTLSQTRTVWHLQYPEWADTVAVPKSTEHFLGFLEELSAVRHHCAGEIGPLHNANPPVFVACSQGVGRSGVTIITDLLLYILEHNQELDIPRVVSLLHQQRANLIQNVHQYRFIHAILIYYLKQTRLI